MEKSTTIRGAGALVAFAMAAAACIPTGVKTGPEEPKKIEPIVPAQAAGPFVQAGTRVTVTMQDVVATETSLPGQSFHATVDEDLASPGGVVVVPKGSTVSGHVARIHRGATPVLALDFDTVETKAGDAPLQAKIKQVKTEKFTGLAEVYDPYLTTYDRRMYPTDAVVFLSGKEPVPLPYPYYFATTQELRVPAGSAMTIELTRAIVPPPAR